MESDFGGRVSVVGIATREGMDDPGIDYWRGDIFWTHPDLVAHPPIKWVPSLFPGVKAAEAWRLQQTPFSAEVKERV